MKPKYKFFRKIDILRFNNQKRNEIRRVLDQIEKLVFSFKIRDNPVLERLKKEDWVVNIHNKALLSWANKYTLDIVRASLLGESSDKE